MPEPDATLAVAVARLDDLRIDVRHLRDEVQDSRRDNASRGEWGQRNSAVDARFEGQGREIAQLRQDINSRRAPWWSTASVLLAGVAFAWTVLGPVV